MQIIKQNIKKVKLPFLTLHGTKDKVVHIASSQFLMEQTPSKDKTMKVLHYFLFHTLKGFTDYTFNKIIEDELFTALVWLSWVPKIVNNFKDSVKSINFCYLIKG